MTRSFGTSKLNATPSLASSTSWQSKRLRIIARAGSKSYEAFAEYAKNFAEQDLKSFGACATRFASVVKTLEVSNA